MTTPIVMTSSFPDGLVGLSEGLRQGGCTRLFYAMFPGPGQESLLDVVLPAEEKVAMSDTMARFASPDWDESAARTAGGEARES